MGNGTNCARPRERIPARRARSMMEEVSDSAIKEFLTILEEHKKTCEREGKYLEADGAQRPPQPPRHRSPLVAIPVSPPPPGLVAKRRLEELKSHEEHRRQEGLRSRQIAQRLGVEEAHMLEFQQFNAAWDAKMEEYEQRATELLEAMRQRHILDHQEFGRKAAAEPPRKPKFSTELLDLRRIEVTLARQGEYAEAQKVKLQADATEAAELERLGEARQQQLASAEAKLVARQEHELNALRQRIQSGAEEQRKARQQDLERLLQRYHNVKAPAPRGAPPSPHPPASERAAPRRRSSMRNKTPSGCAIARGSLASRTRRQAPFLSPRAHVQPPSHHRIRVGRLRPSCRPASAAPELAAADAATPRRTEPQAERRS